MKVKALQQRFVFNRAIERAYPYLLLTRYKFIPTFVYIASLGISLFRIEWGIKYSISCCRGVVNTIGTRGKP